MKQQTNIEVSPYFDDRGNFKREQSITLTIDEYTPTSRCKPKESIIQELKQQKKQILEAKRENCNYPIESIEVSIGKIIHKKSKGMKKEAQEQIKKTIELLKELQRERNLTSISRDYILTILKHFTNLNDSRTRNRYIQSILNKAVSKRERVITKKVLVNDFNIEKRFKGELTKSKTYSCDRVWKPKNDYVEFYSFV